MTSLKNTGAGENPIPNSGPSRLCDEPNAYARPGRVDFTESRAIFHGYQEFTLCRNDIQISRQDDILKRKADCLSRFFNPRYLKHRTVLDLGANGGFYCFWALQHGAEKAIALDLDKRYLHMLTEARDRLDFPNLEIVEANVIDWHKPADITLALGLVHWIFSCTALFGRIDRIIEKLAHLTRYLSIIEWIDPEDPAIGFFHHLDWNKDRVEGQYSFPEFEASLTRHFARHEIIGEISPTRKLIAAFSTDKEIDLSGPLPFIMPKRQIMYSKRITSFEGAEYWSRIYNDGDVFYKQTTSDLAKREGQFLGQMTSDYFPKAFEVIEGEGYSVVAMEKIKGIPLLEAKAEIIANSQTLYNFVIHCLRLLGELKQQGILHRDIRPDNIIVRRKRPVLIDFSWAVSESMPYFTPALLGGHERPPDGSFCDAYSMGKVLEQVNQHRFPTFDRVIELMANPNICLRITNLNILETLFTWAAVVK